MGENSGISWTDNTFNPWWGCERVSPGCANCYAETFSRRLGLDLWGPGSPFRFFGEKHWNEPLAWDRKAKASGKPALVFCASMADVFQDERVLDPVRERLWALIAATPNLRWLLLTKRPQNAAALTPSAWRHAWPSNVWAGVTCENQEWANKRVPILLRIPARVRWLSIEPMLGPVDLIEAGAKINGKLNVRTGARAFIDWAIYGGESGSVARKLNVEWIRVGIRQCRTLGIRPFVKQLGSRPIDREWTENNIQYTEGSRFKGKADNPAEWPEDLRVQEYPE